MNRGEVRERVVYGLTVDGTRFAYVGATSQNTKTRLWEHRSRARSGHAGPVYQWMRSVGVENVQIVRLVSVLTGGDLKRAEAETIACYLEAGHPLVNEISRDGEVDSHSTQSKRRIGDSNRGRVTWIAGKTGESAGWSDERRAAQAARISEINRSRRAA